MYLFITILIMEILGGAEVDIFVPSFPDLQRTFNLSPFMVELTLARKFDSSLFDIVNCWKLRGQVRPSAYYSNRPLHLYCRERVLYLLNRLLAPSLWAFFARGRHIGACCIILSCYCG